VEKGAVIGDDGTEAKITPLWRPVLSLPQRLSAEQEADAQRLFQSLKRTTNDDRLALARLLASTNDRDLLGQTEFAVRDRVHHSGAQAIETALQERKKGATKAPA